MKVTVTAQNSGPLFEQMFRDEAVKIATDILVDLQIATPVDTGALRNGYQLSAEGLTATISNPLPYAMRVMNDGHSKQAPSGTLDLILDKHRR